jgi:hypothetical protein
MNLQEHIRKVLLQESLKQTLMDEIRRSGIRDTASIMSVDVEELLDMVGIRGTKDDMIFLAKSIMDNDVKQKLDYCSYNIVPTRYSIDIDVFIPKPAPENENRYMYDQRLRNHAYELISELIYKLGCGLVRGHNINVYNTGNC